MESVVYYSTVDPINHELVLRHTVVVQHCANDAMAYWRGMAALWDTASAIVCIEHDMQVSDVLVDELLVCPNPLCTHAYQMHIPHDFYAHSVSLSGWQPPIDNLSRYTARGIRWIGPRDEWADFSGIGFCKITPNARTGPLLQQPWNGLEMSVNAAVGARWHVHHPGVSHYHR